MRRLPRLLPLAALALMPFTIDAADLEKGFAVEAIDAERHHPEHWKSTCAVGVEPVHPYLEPDSFPLSTVLLTPRCQDILGGRSRIVHNRTIAAIVSRRGRKTADISTMPTGLLDTYSEGEIYDLLAFIQSVSQP